MFRNRRGIALISKWMLVGIMALLPAVGHALALGKLKVLSALNEPLNAEIALTSITEKELKGLSVSLASRSDFNDAGVERLPFLSELKFVVDRKSDGRHFLQLRTDQQINEPFLHLLLKVEWPGGLLVREYTALIDPPYKITGKAAPVETPVVTPPAPEPVAAYAGNTATRSRSRGSPGGNGKRRNPAYRRQAGRTKSTRGTESRSRTPPRRSCQRSTTPRGGAG